MNDLFLIMNPASRAGRSKKAFAQILDLVGRSGLDYEYRLTKSLDDAHGLSTFANLNGYKKIVAVGGDGTINAVVNGFFDNNGQRLSKASLGVVYTGTSPDFNKSYRLPLDVPSAVHNVLLGQTMDIPVGMVTFGGERRVRYFVCCANIGLGAELARKANGGIRKRLGDFCGTFVSLVGLLRTFQPFGLDLTQPQGGSRLTKMVNLSVGITPYIASGLKVPADRCAEKGQFYLMAARDLDFPRTIRLLNKVYRGKPFANTSYLSLDFTNWIDVASPSSIEVEADGDPIGHLPCRIDFAQPLPLLVPVRG